MIEYGHICLLIFAQGVWKESYRKRILEEISEKFISNMEIDEIDLWAEIQKSPLFDPKNPKNPNEPYEVCHALYEIFEEKRGNNNGLILFSHNIFGWKGMERFLLFVLGESNIKKIYYLELDEFSYLTSASKKIPEILEKISNLKINRSKFFELFKNKKIEFSTLYEVGKY